MPIIIEHRFLNRLLPEKSAKKINVIIMGTFNPAAPIVDLLTEEERKDFAAIEKMRSFVKLSVVKNFYDRPQNRFWKIMDRIHDEKFYQNKDIKTKNIRGLKYYKGMDREAVFHRQQKFCLDRGIFITDMVRVIEPKSFDTIYRNFPDLGIEQSKCEWNTGGILTTIEKHQTKSILINFKLDEKKLPNISREVMRIQEKHPNKVFYVDSPSGSAGNTYAQLYATWNKHFN
jgi:hypothetical protein